ncbi:MAG TPA: 23S rRNA (uracil(1939)-C(5))-methyltransferase RlmD [Clostridia bacterium]|nr:23S rRNA (uracil(1939)-C(5))-methyltransferase RlmD [Clostridia bacterium]
MLNISDIVEIEITAYGSNGEGIGEKDGYVFFVPAVAVGDKLRVKITHIKKNVVFAKPIKLITSGCGRANPPCPVYDKCGGCQLQHLTYAEQLVFKKNLVQNNLRKIGGIDYLVPDVIPSGEVWRYRNKLNMPVGMNGNFISGLYKNDTHEIVPVDECLLQQSWAKELVVTVKEFLSKFGLDAYDEKTRKGLLRHIVGRQVNGQLLVILVINGDALPYAEVLLKTLQNKFAEVGLFVNINKKNTNVILGDKTVHIGGLTEISGEQFGVKFTLRPQSFYQVNESVKDKIYGKVKELLQLSDIEILIDAYSGAGILSGALYSKKYMTYGIEIEQDAVADADEMKKRNGLDNLVNICGDVETELVKIIESNKGKNIAMIVDPPRKGLGEKVTDTILRAKPKSLVYISCDSATLARDLKKLIGGGYELTYLQPFDMFPQTKHVECVVLMSRVEK